MSGPNYGYGNQPITQQPGAPPGQMGGYGMPPGGQPVPPGMVMLQVPPVQPGSIPGCPPGLEYLTTVDQILVKQQVELAEVLLGCEFKNKYKVMNSMGQQVYFAVEDTDCCTRNCCGPLRPFEMQILDNFDAEVLHFSRPLRCQGCLCPCCLQVLEVRSPRSGNTLGYVNEMWSFCVPKFTVENAAHDVIFNIEGPCCTCRCCADVEFNIFSKDGTTKVGAIRKQWTGMLREAFTDADNFNVSFPLDLDVNMKAVLFGALMLIDFMFFEGQNQNNQ